MTHYVSTSATERDFAAGRPLRRQRVDLGSGPHHPQVREARSPLCSPPAMISKNCALKRRPEPFSITSSTSGLRRSSSSEESDSPVWMMILPPNPRARSRLEKGVERQSDTATARDLAET